MPHLFWVTARYLEYFSPIDRTTTIFCSEVAAGTELTDVSLGAGGEIRWCIPMENDVTKPLENAEFTRKHGGYMEYKCKYGTNVANPLYPLNPLQQG